MEAFLNFLLKLNIQVFEFFEWVGLPNRYQTTEEPKFLSGCAFLQRC